jgi:hypothetical protein
MKKIAGSIRSLFPLLAILAFNTSNAQAVNCDSAKTGIFELVSHISGRTVIYRTATTQTEKNDGLDYEASFVVKWVDSCTYELSNKKMIKGDLKYLGQPTDILRVQILKVEGRKVFVRSSSNYSDLVLDRTLTKLE